MNIGEIYRYTGPEQAWAGMPDKPGTLLVANSPNTFPQLEISIMECMITDGTFVKVAEADGTPVEPVKEPGAPEDWVEKERVRLGLDDLPEVLKDENGFTELLRIDTWEDWVGFALGDGYPAHITGGQLGKGDLDKVIIALLYVRDHLKKAGYDF